MRKHIITCVWLVSLSALAACAPKTHRQAAQDTSQAVDFVIAPASVPAPIKDIYSVSEVKILHRGGMDYELVAAATPMYTGSEITAVIHCRAFQEARKLGYPAWNSHVSYTQLSRVEGPRLAGAIVTFTNTPTKGSYLTSNMQHCGA